MDRRSRSGHCGCGSSSTSNLAQTQKPNGQDVRGTPSPRPAAAVLLLTLLGFCVLYAPQPLLPALADAFGQTAADASLLITVTLLPLAAAPLVYGYLLEGMSVRALMVTATVVLAACQAGLAMVDSWGWLLGLRSVEGLALPALFTSLMTFVASSSPTGRVRQALAWYVSATIVGGFLGRAVSGLVAANYGWRIALGMWALPLLLVALAAGRVAPTGRTRYAKITPKVFREVLRQRGLIYAYLAILCVFFVFAGLLNLLPFRLAALDPAITATAIGFAYGGYLSGVAVSLGSQSICEAVGSEARALGLGIGLYASGLMLFALPSVTGHYLAMFLFCGGMFLVHTRLSGQVNHLNEHHRGVVNGLYIAAYYLGGSLGVWLPTLIYRQGGWEIFLAVLGLALLLGTWSLQRFVVITAPA